MKRTIEKELKKWKNKEDRKPLILRGARQIGKTYAIEIFGKQHLKSIDCVMEGYSIPAAALMSIRGNLITSINVSCH